MAFAWQAGGEAERGDLATVPEVRYGDDRAGVC